MTYRERIFAALQDAVWNGQWWVSLAELLKHCQPTNRKSFGVVLHRMEECGEIAVSRRLGYHRRRFALMEPGQFELLMTRLALAFPETEANP